MIHPYSHFPARAARQWPDRIALIEGDRQRTYAELNANADRVAKGLVKLGLAPGDRVALIQKNCIEYVESVIGVARAGGVLVPILGALTEQEYTFMIEDTEAKFVMAVGADMVPRALTAAGERAPVLSFGRADEAVDLTSLAGAADLELPVVDLPPSSIAQILYSSGTTGTPKGITHSYAGVSAAMNFWAQTFNLDPIDRLLGQLPLSHFGGRAMDSAWVAGASLVILPDADPGVILAAIDRDEITMMLAVPTLLRMLLDHPSAATSDLGSLRVLVYAASPAAPSLVRRTLERLGPVLYTGFGQTEAYGLNTIMGPDEHKEAIAGPEERLGSIGRESPQAQVRLRTDDGRDVAPGEVGEIWLCAPWATPGFWRRPDLDETRLSDGWLRTGDLAYLGENGYFYLADRKEDMIITGGFNVYPVEVENALMEHEAVAECGVFSVPDKKWGEAVNASVVLRSGRGTSPEDLIAFCKTRLAPFKVPKAIHVADELPKTNVGKILRRKLRESFWDDESRQIHGAE